LAEYISDERLRRYGLKPRVEKVFGYKMTTYKEAAVGQASFAFASSNRLSVMAKRADALG
ncbi:MAG: hypothetical protein IIC29_02800, partial [Chloroflexi bacterium]|nr:hypothetical protein [Chloroflexota bacterium]